MGGRLVVGFPAGLSLTSFHSPNSILLGVLNALKNGRLGAGWSGRAPGRPATWPLPVPGVEHTPSAAKSSAITGFGMTRKIQAHAAEDAEHGGNKDKYLPGKEKAKATAMA